MVKLRKRKGMPRDGLVQAGISNFVQKFPSLGLARGVANGENKNLSDYVLAGEKKSDGQVDLTVSSRPLHCSKSEIYLQR
jgi:hypothetical protein